MIKKSSKVGACFCALLIAVSSIVYSQSPSKKWKRFIKESIPELDRNFKFQSSSDKDKALSNTIFVVIWQRSISDKLHCNPSLFKIESYTCLMCDKFVSLSTFKEDQTIITPFSMEYCGANAQKSVEVATNVVTTTDNNQLQGGTYSYNAGDDGSGFTADRFLSSPCYGAIGFSPTWDRKMLDARYCACENQKRWKQFGVGAIITLLIGVVGLMVWLSRRKASKHH